MGRFTPLAAPAALLALFAEERKALRAGALDRVADIAARKEALLDALDGAAMSAATLSELEESAGRNALLLAASAEGIRQALLRLRDLQSATGGVTYGPDGRQRQTIPHGVSKRL